MRLLDNDLDLAAQYEGVTLRKSQSDELCELCKCVVDGGGKYLGTANAVSLLRLSVSGAAASTGSGSFSGNGGITGGFTAWNALKRTMIESTAIAAMSAFDGGTETSVFVNATAKVNGTLTPVYLRIKKDASGTQFTVEEQSTSSVIAGGAGETGRNEIAIVISVG
jgi:hypothetical protein